MPNRTYGTEVKVINYLADDIRSWRAVERLTQIEAAKLLNCAPRTLHRWENGHIELPKGFSERFQLAMDKVKFANEGGMFIPRDPHAARIEGRARGLMPKLRAELVDDWYSELTFPKPYTNTWLAYLGYRRECYERLGNDAIVGAIDLLTAEPEAQWPAWPTNEQITASSKRHTK